MCNEIEGNIDLKMFLDSENPGKTCNSKIKLGPWKIEQHFSYTKTIWYTHWSDPLELEYKLLKSWAPLHFDEGRQCEPSIWNASALKMLFCTLIGVILLHQTPKNSPDVNTLDGYKCTFFSTPTPVNRPIWNLDLKSFTNEDTIVNSYWSEHSDL